MRDEEYQELREWLMDEKGVLLHDTETLLGVIAGLRRELETANARREAAEMFGTIYQNLIKSRLITDKRLIDAFEERERERGMAHTALKALWEAIDEGTMLPLGVAAQVAFALQELEREGER